MMNLSTEPTSEVIPSSSDENTFNESYTQLAAGLKVEAHEHRSNTIKLINNFINNIHPSESTYLLTVLCRIARDLKFHFCENISKLGLALQIQRQQCEHDSIAELLQENVDVLSCFHSLVNRLKTSIHYVCIENINDLLQDVIFVLSTTYEHCKENEIIYGAIPEINSFVTGLLRKCNELQTEYLEVLSVLKIDGNEHSQLMVNLLDKVIDAGVIVFDLEMKTMLQIWKGFVSVLKVHSPYLRSQFDVSRVIGFMCNQITEKIAGSYVEHEKSRTLTLKILFFLLKIIVKICEHFVDCLERCCSVLFDLILCLYQNSKNNALLKGEHVDIAAEIETCLLAAVDPLVTALVNDRGFAKYFLEYKPESTSGVPLLLFASMVMQKLTLSAPEIQSFWFQNSMLDYVLRLVAENEEELCYEVLVTAPVTPQLPQEIFLYDTLVVHLSNLIICGVDNENFHHLEELLMYNLLNASLVTKVFVSDLWCILIRYGNTELRYKHIAYLFAVLNEIQNEKIETVFLTSLIKRFFTCLSHSQQLKALDLMKHHRDLMAELGSYCDVQLPKDVIDETKEQIVERAERSLDTKLNTDIMKSIALVSNAADFRLNSIIQTFVIDCWRQLTEDVDAENFINWIPYLCAASAKHNIRTIAILRNIENIINYESIFAALNILKYLRSLGACIFADNENEFCCALASIFKSLFKHHNTIVRQKTLETFSYFSHVTKYEKIIEMTVGNDAAIAQNMADYLQNKRTRIRITRKYSEFLKILFQSKPIFVTKEKDTFHELPPQPSKKIKLQINFENEIHKIESTAVNLLHNLNNSELDLTQKQLLNKMLNTVDKLRTFL